jgi:hypothetical protein
MVAYPSRLRIRSVWRRAFGNGSGTSTPDQTMLIFHLLERLVETDLTGKFIFGLAAS